ncbi:MAG: ABC transporter permease [Bacteroidia bacterium]|nr:ABC transporter permease [Bacteroidia bacterium]
MKPADNIALAFQSLSNHKQRAVITILIISIGIMALVGIFSAIEALRRSVEINFSEAGSNTFNIEPLWQGRGRFRTNRLITYREAMEFKKKFSSKAVVCIKVTALGNALLRFENKKTNPNVEVIGTDENYLLVNAATLEQGRMFSGEEAFSGRPVAIIGKEIKSFLFGNLPCLHRTVQFGNVKFRVIGVLESKGSGMGFGMDRSMIIPISVARQYFIKTNTNYDISCISPSLSEMNPLMDEATGYFRNIRKLKVWQENDFEITKSDNLVSIVMKDISMITGGAAFIGAITLFGAGIGLMNIMLISVQERYREIGIRKAMGATRRDIAIQFLSESVVIGILGGVIGIALGVFIGNVVSIVLNSGIFIPWKWVTGGVLLCLVVGILSGWIPARRAASVDPIESLRYE